MSVPVNKRGESSVKFLDLADKIRNTITMLLIKDFGVKTISKDLKSFTHSAKMTREDKETFMSICEKYHIDVEAEYPLWVIEYFRSLVLEILKDFTWNLTTANTIYATNIAEMNLRRQYQWKAIADCEQLIQAFQWAVNVLPVDKNKYMGFIDMINMEIELLRKWKKSDNKYRSMLELKEAEKLLEQSLKNSGRYVKNDRIVRCPISFMTKKEHEEFIDSYNPKPINIEKLSKYTLSSDN